MFNVAQAAAAIAVQLGREWQTEPGHMLNGHDAYLCGPGDIRIRVGIDHYKKRGQNRIFLSEAIAGDLRKFVHGDLVISVSQERAARDITAEIRRRLLPDIEEAVRKARIDKVSSDARDAAHEATRDSIAKSLDGHTYAHDQNNVHFGSCGSGVSGAVEVHKYGGDVKFVVRVPKGLAPAMADTVAALSSADVPRMPEFEPDMKPELQKSATQAKRRRKRQPLTPEERKERVEALQGRLQASIAELADADRWAEFLRAAQGFGTTWSFNNLMLITVQAAERGFIPTMVKTFEAWKKLGRSIKTGEKALYIFEPVKYRLSPEEAKKEGRAGFDSDGKPRMVVRGVRPSPRFDVSQTEGEPMPESLGVLTLSTEDDFAGLWETITNQIRETGYTVVGGPPGLLDSYTDPGTGEVWVCDTLDDGPAAVAAIKELAHILLSHLDDPEEYRQHRGQMDAEARSVAFIVAGALGMDTASTFVTPDVASWRNGDTDALADAADRVTATAQQIIRAVEDATIG